MTTATAQGTYTPPKVAAKYTKELQAAVLLAQSGQMEPAMASIKEIIEKNPGWTEPHQELARIYYDARRTEEAIAQLEVALRIDTLSQLQQLYTLGRLYEEVDAPEKAAEGTPSLAASQAAPLQHTQSGRVRVCAFWCLHGA